MEKFEQFKNRYESFKAMEAERRKQAGKMSNIRLFVFLAGISVGLLLFVKTGILFGIFFTGCFLGAFVYLVILHQRMMREISGLSCKAEINHRYMERMKSGWVKFEDGGQDFVNPANSFTGDLDIFGPKSLYQWINAAKTYNGRIALKELLETPDKNAAEILKRQKAVKELSDKLDFCQELQSEGLLAEGVAENPEKLLMYAEEPAVRFKNKSLINLFYLMPFAFFLTFTLWTLGSPIPLFIPISLLTAQMILFAVGYKKNAKIVNSVYGLKNHLGAYGNLLKLIEKEEFTDTTLLEYKGKIATTGISASSSLKKLESISIAIDLKFSTVLYFLLNFLLLWDFHCVFALEEWKDQYGKRIREWLGTVGKVEAFASLALIGQLYPEWVFPVITNKRLNFSAAGMGHPLIPKDVCIRNDFEINKGACVITGSNMSGKTTLLRTVGINLVLAYAGAPVFADRLECAVMDVFTSMRVHDDLNSGISTFYAELLRVKMMIDYAKEELPMIYLIDEIFMGTNSLDRITGARSVLKNLNKNWVIGLISTHDFELCDLEQENGVDIKNYHFTENYINDEICFDYKLRSGRSRTTNAKYLMRLVGIELEG